MRSESSERRGYREARAALRFAEMAERIMVWVGFRLSRPAVPVQ